MGVTLTCKLKASEIIDIISIIVNIILTWRIVYVVQNKLNNKRVLKYHYISEIKVIREEFRYHLNSLFSNNISPKNIIPWYKLMSIKLSNLSIDLYDSYNTELYVFNEYQNKLRDLITDSNDFITQFNNEKLIVSVELKNEIIKFQQINSRTFNDLIVKINNT